MGPEDGSIAVRIRLERPSFQCLDLLRTQMPEYEVLDLLANRDET